MDDNTLQHMEELHRKVDALNSLVQVSLVMNSTLELDPLLQYIMQAAAEITGAETASILLMDDNTRDLRFVATTDPDAGGLKGVSVPLEGSIAGAIVNEKRALIIDDTQTDPRHFSQIDKEIDFQTRSLLGVPMRIKERLVGVLEVINKREGVFDDNDVRHITILASQAAVAIETAQLVEALRVANDELEQVNKLKSDFIAIASHELRTPLGIILGYASFLQEEAEGTASEHAKRVLDSAMHLRSIIEDMTNLRFVQIDRSELELETVDVRDLVEEAHQDVARMAEAKEQVILIEVPPTPMTATVDPKLITMALTNVLNNAVKFTDQQGVIEIDASQQGEEIRLRVRDNGMGLSAEHHDRVFNQFYQVEDHLTRRHNGMGLGLSIAKAILERHEGRIWVESDGEGQGCTFWLAFPQETTAV
jgi:signal transduction histidine kinase